MTMKILKVLECNWFQIDVIGFKKHTLLDDEDFDTAFPSIGKSGFDHQNMTFASNRPLTSSS